MKKSLAAALFLAVIGAIGMNAVVNAQQQTGVGPNQNVVTGSVDKSVRLWEAFSGKQIAAFANKAHFGAVRSEGATVVETSGKVWGWEFVDDWKPSVGLLLGMPKP